MRARLASPRAHHWLGPLSLVLLAPALAGGLFLDDHVLKLLASDTPGLAGFHPDPLFLFSFTSGRAVDNTALMNAGALLPWWSDPGHLNAFFRPLSSLTHLLDFALWPDAPWLMHLHSLFWFAALMGTVAHHYRRLPHGAPFVAGLSFAIFALDEAHGMTVGWIANRNALVAATLALPALGAHHRYRTEGWMPGRWLGPLVFALGLSAGETAVGVFGYLLAHALILERPREGLPALWPYLLLLFAHRAVFAALGLGSAGSGIYHDPLGEPFAYALSLARNLPILLSAQLTLPMADLAFWGPPEALPLLIAGAVLGVAVVAWLARHALAQPGARFWALGMVLSACVVAASVPGERLLLVPSIGGSALLAAMLAPLLSGAEVPRAERPLLAALLLVHLIVSPLSLPIRTSVTTLLGQAIDRVDEGLPAGEALGGRRVLFLNAPVEVLVSYLQVRRAARGEPVAESLSWLASTSSDLEIERTGPRTLRATLSRGFLYTPIERHYRGSLDELGVGAEVRHAAFTARVVEVTDDGRPKRVDFELSGDPEDGRWLFFEIVDGAPQRVELPAVGETRRYPRSEIVELLVRQALR